MGERKRTIYFDAINNILLCVFVFLVGLILVCLALISITLKSVGTVFIVPADALRKLEEGIIDAINESL